MEENERIVSSGDHVGENVGTYDHAQEGNDVLDNQSDGSQEMENDGPFDHVVREGNDGHDSGEVIGNDAQEIDDLAWEAIGRYVCGEEKHYHGLVRERNHEEVVGNEIGAWEGIDCARTFSREEGKEIDGAERNEESVCYPVERGHDVHG